MLPVGYVYTRAYLGPPLSVSFLPLVHALRSPDHGERHVPAAARRTLYAPQAKLLQLVLVLTLRWTAHAGTFDLLVYTDAASAVPSEWYAPAF
jgi:hypothetical protein